jgi:hypothetical protein
MDGKSGSDGLFALVIEGHDLGMFTMCWGLDAEPATGMVVLSRPLTGDAAIVSAWIQGRAGGSVGASGEITMLGPERAPLACWSLEDVVPVQWTRGTGESSAHETLELSCAGLSQVIHGRSKIMM